MCKYSKEEIDFYKDLFPNYSEADVINMLKEADFQAQLASYESKYQL